MNGNVNYVIITTVVCQGGVLSPKPFSVYMDDLSKLLINSDSGYFIDNVCFNHVFHVNDLCLVAACAIMLRE